MRVLVVGGAGFIGSVTTAELLKAGHEVTVFDNFSLGHRSAVPEGVRIVEGDLLVKDSLARVFAEWPVEAVVHFGGSTEVSVSMREPGRFFENNVTGSINLVNAMLAADVRRIVFSSSGSVYGEPERLPMDEEHPLRPASVYAETKAMVERILTWHTRLSGLKAVALRYFNAAGASELYGEDHMIETHLIPNILKVPLGHREAFTLFGDDYPTKDGTCIRDYVHVVDLAVAHLLALDFTETGSDVFNLGSGTGSTNMEVVNAARKASGHPIPVKIEGRRPGDPVASVASNAKAKAVLGWKPRFDDIERIVSDAWNWHKAHPNGYGD